jgi:hypothetical protein
MSRWNDTAIFAARNSKNDGLVFFEAKGDPLTTALEGKLYLKG